MWYSAVINIETDWDQADGYIEEEFQANSLEEAVEKVKNSVLYNQTDFNSAINEEFDYNWQIIPDIVEWTEAASLLSEHHDLENYGHKVENITVTVSPLPEKSVTFDLSKAWKEQNEQLANAEEIRKKRAQFERLKEELGED